MSLPRRSLIPAVLMALLGALAFPRATTAHASDQGDPLPRVPPGFAVTNFSHVEGLATSLTFGPDTREGAGKGATRLYAANYATGEVVVIDDLGGIGTAPSVFADGFSNPLGVVVGADGAVYVADSESVRKGPYGNRVYGRVWRVRDTDGDGVGDKKQVVLKDLPNGRHNTNGMAFGPDGMLYVTNGNSTDDGVEGGDPEVIPWSGSVVRVDPRATNVSLADLNPKKALVATGMRNLYDVAFSPVDKSRLYIPMNGVDDAREGSTGESPIEDLENSDDLLFAADVATPKADHFGYPSCLYNLEKKGNLKPYDNPNSQAIKRFGPCNERAITPPAMSFGLHVSADGAAFQETKAWGAGYRNDLFVAEFGNFFGAEVVGHRVVRVEFDKSGKKVVRHSEFLSDVVPLDLTFDGDGNMFVADFSGKIFRVQRVAELPGTIDVQMNGFQFLPQALVVPEGTTVRWTNEEVAGVAHNVRGQFVAKADGTAGPIEEPRSDDIPVGKSFSYRFETPGEFVYTCTVSPMHRVLMHGSITVVPAGN